MMICKNGYRTEKKNYHNILIISNRKKANLLKGFAFLLLLFLFSLSLLILMDRYMLINDKP